MLYTNKYTTTGTLKNLKKETIFGCTKINYCPYKYFVK